MHLHYFLLFFINSHMKSDRVRLLFSFYIKKLLPDTFVSATLYVLIQFKLILNDRNVGIKISQ
jgi:hypothetical protein